MVIPRLTRFGVRQQDDGCGLKGGQESRDESLLHMLDELTTPDEIESEVMVPGRPRPLSEVMLFDARMILWNSFHAKSWNPKRREVVYGGSIATTHVKNRLHSKVRNQPCPHVREPRRWISSGQVPAQVSVCYRPAHVVVSLYARNSQVFSPTLMKIFPASAPP